MAISGLRGGILAILLLVSHGVFAQSPEDLIRQAQEAAWADRNAEAVALYEQAFAGDPDLRAAYLREYADQLTYAGRAAEAVPLYRSVLQGRAGRDARKTAQRGLALALGWSGQAEAAVNAWDRVLQDTPGDVDARRNRDKLLVDAARSAARADRNGAAAALFGRALDGAEGPPVGLVREYADQLAYSGRHAQAMRLYDRILAAEGVDGATRQAALRGRALALQWSGQTARAASAWQGVLRRNPGDTDARLNLADVMMDQARQAADENLNADAVTLYETAFRIAPSRRRGVTLDYAYQLAYAGRPRDAADEFARIVAQQERSGTDRQAHRGLGMALGWAGAHEAALAAFDRGLARYPDDVEMLTGKAEVLVWMNRPREARALFERALLVRPDDEKALRGVAQSDSYLGRQRLASDRLREVISQGDASADTVLVAARAEYWKGRPDKAHVLANRVLADAPDHSGALDLIEEIDDSQRPTTSVFQGWSTQNDGLEITTTTARHGLTFGDGLTSGGVQARRIVLDPDAGGDVVLEGPGFFVRHRFTDDVEANASFHLNTLTGDGFRHDELTLDSWLTYWANDRVRYDFSLSRNYFDDVRSLEANILMTSLGVSADFMPVPGTQLSGRLQLSDLSDGNSRVFLQLEGQRQVVSVDGLHLGGKLTYFSFSAPELDNGYFNPAWLYSAQGTARYAMDLSQRWRVEATVGVGFERRADLDKLLWNVGAKASYALTERAALDFEFRHNDHKRVDPVDGFVRTSIGLRLVYRW